MGTKQLPRQQHIHTQRPQVLRVCCRCNFAWNEDTSCCLAHPAAFFLFASFVISFQFFTIFTYFALLLYFFILLSSIRSFCWNLDTSLVYFARAHLICPSIWQLRLRKVKVSRGSARHNLVDTPPPVPVCLSSFSPKIRHEKKKQHTYGLCLMHSLFNQQSLTYCCCYRFLLRVTSAASLLKLWSLLAAATLTRSRTFVCIFISFILFILFLILLHFFLLLRLKQAMKPHLNFKQSFILILCINWGWSTHINADRSCWCSWWARNGAVIYFWGATEIASHGVKIVFVLFLYWEKFNGLTHMQWGW